MKLLTVLLLCSCIAFAFGAGKCKEEHDDAVQFYDDNPGFVGREIPRCDDNGDYQPKQCNPSTGYCRCVNKMGETTYEAESRAERLDCSKHM